jgi:hypothetical protein
MKTTPKASKMNGAKIQGIPADEDRPLHDQKHLLKTGRTYTRLELKNMTLRGTLATLQENIAVAIHVENWSRFPLTQTQLQLVAGKINEIGDTLAPPPGKIEPGTHDYGVVLQGAPLTGTNGVVRWSIGNMDRVLSVMWSVPYNRQLWRTWLAVGLTSHGPDLPSYDDMYDGQNSDGKFVRRKAGHQVNILLTCAPTISNEKEKEKKTYENLEIGRVIFFVSIYQHDRNIITLSYILLFVPIYYVN